MDLAVVAMVVLLDFRWWLLCCGFDVVAGLDEKELCGAREFMTPVHFTLRPKTRAEEGHCRGHTAKVQMA